MPHEKDVDTARQQELFDDLIGSGFEDPRLWRRG